MRRIHRLLNQEGYTVRGVQKVLRDRDAPAAEPAAVAMPAPAPAFEPVASEDVPAGVDVFRLIQLRNRLAEALDA